MPYIRKASWIPVSISDTDRRHSDRTKAYRQMTLFQDYVERIERELDIKIPMKHCSNSAGIIEMPEAQMDAVRAGIILYGLWPSDEVQICLMSARPSSSGCMPIRVMPVSILMCTLHCFPCFTAALDSSCAVS